MTMTRQPKAVWVLLFLGLCSAFCGVQNTAEASHGDTKRRTSCWSSPMIGRLATQARTVATGLKHRPSIGWRTKEFCLPTRLQIIRSVARAGRVS